MKSCAMEEDHRGLPTKPAPNLSPAFIPIPISSLAQFFFFLFFDRAVWLVGSQFPNLGPPAVKAQSPNHWTAREFPLVPIFKPPPPVKKINRLYFLEQF